MIMHPGEGGASRIPDSGRGGAPVEVVPDENMGTGTCFQGTPESSEEADVRMTLERR